MPESDEKPLVVIRSLVYNHEPYLRDCLEGFVMQQTTFPFVAVVHDDCSTDGSAAIIREYAEKYPHIIKPVYETENQYSKRDGSLRRAMDAACGKYGAKYYALCEGDDYWTDPHKLQKQVDFMEAHPDYTMVFCNGVIEMPQGRLETDDDYRRIGWPHITESREISTREMILDVGGLVHTAGMVYRNGIKDDYPEACKKCHTGDTPLQIMASLKGRVFYFHDSMIVYRYLRPGSWTSIYATNLESTMLKKWSTTFEMYESLDMYSQHRYRSYFRLAEQTLALSFLRKYPTSTQIVLDAFGSYLKYERISECKDHHTDIWSKTKLLLLRFCFFPYYPDPNTPNLLRPQLRPFYRASWRKRTICVGKIGIITFVRQDDGSDILYILGKRIN